MTNCIWHLLLTDIVAIEKHYTMVRSGTTFDFYDDVVPFVQTIDAHLLHFQNTVPPDSIQTSPQYTRIINLLKTLSVVCHDVRTSKKHFYDQLKTVKHDVLFLQQQVGK
ncbi:DUF1798 family protein [Staphylococcus sp. 17KM0847]|uniref:DUF1798 family protein n=1 Tax=Staphylococcus sp. 17KM0847 TaxID=2583989 RepID=UPI0015DBD5E4|nr:DUF1798 family protein [Staphylococcus sp. 17KM0847]QLK86163.1 DUF1798 family protein [Staphylococcus sp. 17KM0847]